ncbi:HAMP domain-containing protein, partial [Acinetobacter baumannii]
MLAVSLMVLTGAWTFATVTVARHVGRLATMARKLGSGDLSVRIPPPHPRGQLGGLMTQLNATAESLER